MKPPCDVAIIRSGDGGISVRILVSGGAGWIRNAYMHEKHCLPEIGPDEALELLFVASYLLRMVDCASGPPG
jgi:hypothetical protein